MEIFRELGKADYSDIKYLRVMPFRNVVKSSYAPMRVENWYGYASNLQSIKDGRVEINWVADFPSWIDSLRKKYFPESDSCLVCKGQRPESDTTIDWHRDHGTFENKVVMINYGLAYFYIDNYGDTKVIPLNDGVVVEFDSKLPHKAIQTSDERYIITFRKTKKEFRKYKLF